MHPQVDYYTAVHKRSLNYLRGVSADDLDRVPDEPWCNSPRTEGVRLISVIDDSLEHVGQMPTFSLLQPGWSP